jgi:hypothetical protein
VHHIATIVLIALAVAAFAPRPAAAAATSRLLAPPKGTLYHGVFPGGTSGMEDDITLAQVRSYERAVGRRVAWVTFSHNWYQGAQFPLKTAEWIREMGAAPHVRLMLREEDESIPNRFSIEAVLDGGLDRDFREWGLAAAAFGSPLMVEFGTECNGEWFPWNGRHHGAGEADGFGDPEKPDGPERFAAAYRRLVDLVRGAGARNVTWIFHVNASDWPDTDWNRFEHYYPGDEYVDWLAVSAYGPQQPTEDEAEPFRDQFDPCYARLRRMAPEKPILALEFGCTVGSSAAAPQAWAGAALDDLLGERWPRLIGFGWWNERWQNDDDPAHDTDMKVENIPRLAEAFRARLARAGPAVVDRPMVSTDAPSRDAS